MAGPPIRALSWRITTLVHGSLRTMTLWAPSYPYGIQITELRGLRMTPGQSTFLSGCAVRSTGTRKSVGSEVGSASLWRY